MPNLHRVVLKASDATAFVRISASWSFYLTNWRLMIFFSSFSFMKCLSISTCLVRSYWIGFSEMLMVALLSQYRLHASFWWNFTSGKKRICPNHLLRFLIYAAINRKNNKKKKNRSPQQITSNAAVISSTSTTLRASPTPSYSPPLDGLALNS